MTPEQMRTLRGPMLLRTEGEQASTFDQRLLESGADHEWQHADPWRVLRIQGEFVAGFDALSKLPKAVTVFGSARTTPEDASYQLGVEVGRKLAEQCAPTLKRLSMELGGAAPLIVFADADLGRPAAVQRVVAIVAHHEEMALRHQHGVTVVGGAIGGALGFYMLSLVGFDPGAKTNSEAATWGMLATATFIPMGCFLVSGWLMRAYPITSRRHAAIRRAIARRGMASAAVGGEQSAVGEAGTILVAR